MRFLRPILAVLAAYLAMAVLGMTLFLVLALALGKERMFETDSYRAAAVVSAAALCISVVIALVAGVICIRIARSRRPVIVLAMLVLVFGMASAVSNERKPDPGARPTDQSLIEAVGQAKEPTWFAFLNPIVGAGCVWLGGLIGRPRWLIVSP